MDLKERIRRSGLTQADVFKIIRDKKGVDVSYPYFCAILNGLYDSKKAKEVLCYTEEILKAKERDFYGKYING